jgi:predicted lipid carrier protein YhbT
MNKDSLLRTPPALLGQLAASVLSNLPTPRPFMAKLGERLPPALVSAHGALLLEIARRAAWLTPPEELDGHSFIIGISDLGLRCAFACQQGRFRPLWQLPESDLEISATLADFVLMARGSMDADTLFFQRRLKISGDTELGLVVKNWLDACERPAWLTAAR